MNAAPAINVGPYEVIRPIGDGGMAEIYLCVRRGVGGFERNVVLKVLHSRYVGDPSFVDMFLTEAKILARLHHPNIVSVFDVGQVEEVPFLAMEFVNGPTLGRLHTQSLKMGLFELGYFLHIVHQICLALHHVHTLEVDGVAAGVVHRDISSTNILIEAESGAVKLIDFGIATQDTDEERKTEVGVLKGRVPYLAPEVLRGRRADARSDLYAIGVLLYRLLTNQLPFPDGDAGWAARMEGRHTRVSLLSSWVSPELEAIVDRALHPNPAQRYATAAELADDVALEVRRLGTHSAGIPAWIRQVFPAGPAAWAPRTEEHSSTSTLHTIGQISRTQVGPAPVSPRTMYPLLAITVALALFSAVLAGSAVGLWWNASHTDGLQAVMDVDGYLRAANELLAEGNFDGAREMVTRATALGQLDADMALAVERQRGTIEREYQRATVRAQLRAGRLDEAAATLSAAMDAQPSDPDLHELFAELQQLRKQPASRARSSAASADIETPLLLPASAAPLPVLETAAPVALAAVPAEAPAPAPTPAPTVRVFHSSELHVKTRASVEYPANARAMGFGDTRCLARVSIDEQGSPYDVEVTDCPRPFQQPTRDAILRWRWEPAVDERGPIRAQTTIAVNFKAR